MPVGAVPKWLRERSVPPAGSRVARQNHNLMYFTYALFSFKNGDIYIGSAENVEKRIALHNTGKVRSTRPYRPWKLLECKEFRTRGEAVRMERFLKTHQQKEILRKKYGAVAKR